MRFLIKGTSEGAESDSFELRLIPLLKVVVIGNRERPCLIQKYQEGEE